MTKNEFILEYTLRHKEVPSFSIMELLSLNKVFDEEKNVEPANEKTYDDARIDIAHLQKTVKLGTRIANILKDGCWGSQYTQVGINSLTKEPRYSVVTIGDLKKVTAVEYYKHRNSGKKSWSQLQEYIENL